MGESPSSDTSARRRSCVSKAELDPPKRFVQLNGCYGDERISQTCTKESMRHYRNVFDEGVRQHDAELKNIDFA